MLRGTTYTKEELDAILEERGCVFIGPYQGARKPVRYNPNKTDEERLLDRDVSQVPIWRKAVFTRDEYTCTICKSVRGGNLAAHHLNAWSSFPEQRFLVENGVTLCSNCHLTFRKKYGFGGNTKEQFMEFLRDNTEVINSVKSVDTVEHRS